VRAIKFSITLMLLLAIGQFAWSGPVSAASFNDVTVFKEEINHLTTIGIINGYPDATFRPDQSITRIQAVQMIMREIGIPENWEPKNPYQFSDVKPGQDGHRDVLRAYELNIVTGKDWDIFDPTGKMTRAEMAKVLVQAYSLGSVNTSQFKDVAPSSWTAPYVRSLAAVNITVGYPDGTFKPNLPISRAHFAVFMARILNPAFKPPTLAVKGAAMQELGILEPLDAVKDSAEPVIYFIEAKTNSLIALNHVTNEQRTVKLPLPAERMALKDGNIYITQLHHPHSSYRQQDQQSGDIAVYDAQTLQLLKSIPVKVDPFDIEVDANGMLYVSSGSGQWTYLQSYSAATGELLSTASGLREQSLIRLNPSATKIYALTTLENPGLRSYLTDQGQLKAGEHSPVQMSAYHPGTHLEVTLNGRYALTNTGETFSVNGMTDGTDMLEDYEADDFVFTSFAESQERNEVYFSRNKRLIRVNSAADMKNQYHMAAYGEVKFIFTDSTRNELVMLSTVKTGKDRKAVLAVEKIAFQP
jgi:DNA-binding beta-propeller fold protein YncE